MALIGNRVLGHLSFAYVTSAAFAGVAGAISAQTSMFVGTSVMSIDTTFDGLVMLVLGGLGGLYGALIGAPVYILIKQVAQEWSPYYWMFVVGALLILVVLFVPGGLLGLLSRGAARLGRGWRRV
jgi:branched-chain amino acid transport system permease protein